VREKLFYCLLCVRSATSESQDCAAAKKRAKPDLIGRDETVLFVRAEKFVSLRDKDSRNNWNKSKRNDVWPGSAEKKSSFLRIYLDGVMDVAMGGR
jgi:hypothetical protein